MIPRVFCACLLATCLLQFSLARSRKHYHSDVVRNALFDNLVEEDLKDEGPGDTEPSDSLESDDETEVDETDETDCSPAARKHTDRYVDKVLSEVRPKLPEPAFLPERVGRFRLFNGTLSNLESLRRTGPAFVRCTDDTSSFLVPIGLRHLTGRYYWENNTGVPVFRGFIDTSIGHVDADILYTRVRDPSDGQPKAKLDKVSITRVQGVKVTFDRQGEGPLNDVSSRFTNLVVRFFSRGVSRALEGPVKNAINKELQNVEKYLEMPKVTPTSFRSKSANFHVGGQNRHLFLRIYHIS